MGLSFYLVLRGFFLLFVGLFLRFFLRLRLSFYGLFDFVNIIQPYLGKHELKELIFLGGQIPLGLNFQHSKDIDGVPGLVKISFDLIAYRIFYLAQLLHGSTLEHDDNLGE